MRTLHWFFVVSVALFISGVAFIVAGARTARAATPAEPASVVQLTPVATVKQIMSGITAPAATVIYTAVGTVVSARGIEETEPRNDEEWARVGANAAALAESGNLLMMSGRAIDEGDWMKMSADLIRTATTAVKAAQDKNKEEILAAGSEINDTCDNCHAKYQRQ
jgi:heme/copper-type cytochrome/quinol oxidase subunit 3